MKYNSKEKTKNGARYKTTRNNKKNMQNRQSPLRITTRKNFCGKYNMQQKRNKGMDMQH